MFMLPKIVIKKFVLKILMNKCHPIFLIRFNTNINLIIKLTF